MPDVRLRLLPLDRSHTGPAPSTISGDIRRNGGAERYREAMPITAQTAQRELRAGTHMIWQRWEAEEVEPEPEPANKDGIGAPVLTGWRQA